MRYFNASRLFVLRKKQSILKKHLHILILCAIIYIELANLLKNRDAKLWCLNGITQMTDRLHQPLLR